MCVTIGEGTYINEYSNIKGGVNSKVLIGKNCAIGRWFTCRSITHDLRCPTRTNDYEQHAIEEKDIIIGDCVWIGDKVTIKEGIKIGDFAVIGANSYVTKDVKPFEIVGGVPAKHIRFNTKHYLYEDYNRNGNNERKGGKR